MKRHERRQIARASAYSSSPTASPIRDYTRVSRPLGHHILDVVRLFYIALRAYAHSLGHFAIGRGVHRLQRIAGLRVLPGRDGSGAQRPIVCLFVVRRCRRCEAAAWGVALPKGWL